ncbi:MAG: hypothetical protein MUF87_19860 [Anaerolineae bacterium]|jgi:hypothetical protein|nr:hypothetical protein [Anaerolineae bacterium]
MPVEASRIEHGIYLSRWVGDLGYEELRQGQLDGLALVKADGITQYVLIIDMLQLGKLLQDVRTMRQIVQSDPHLEHVIVVGVSPALSFLATTLQRLTGRFRDLQFCKTLDEAIQIARQRVADF